MGYVLTDKDYRDYAFRNRIPTAEYRGALDRLYTYSPNAWVYWIRYDDDMYEEFDPDVLEKLLADVESNAADPEW